MTRSSDTQTWIHVLFFDEHGDISYWGPFTVMFAMQTVTYVFCQIVKDNSHIDTVWPWTIMLPNLTVILILLQNGITLDWRTVITNACLWLWGLRLSLHVGCRHKGEDYRYVEMREEA